MATSQAESKDERYLLLNIARSDGMGYSDLLNEPLNPNDDQDATQLERWEVIIGGHLAIQLYPQDETRFKLAKLPRGYELRAALRKGKDHSVSKDYYLYGHPASRRAMYRTPGEFALHCLWLVSASNDNTQCLCDLCPKYVENKLAEMQNAAGLSAAQQSHYQLQQQHQQQQSQQQSQQQQSQQQQTQQQPSQQQPQQQLRLAPAGNAAPALAQALAARQQQQQQQLQTQNQARQQAQPAVPARQQ
ncbi:hypothetical protein QBC35DRAFT_452807, partial [Podospora australis]